MHIVHVLLHLSYGRRMGGQGISVLVRLYLRDMRRPALLERSRACNRSARTRPSSQTLQRSKRNRIHGSHEDNWQVTARDRTAAG
eukprot:5527387-Pleurochrysis_carterae.AAC.1